MAEATLAGKLAQIAPFRPFPFIAASDVSSVVAHTGCSRMIAAAHLEATHGDVEAACASWRGDHGGWAARVAYQRFERSLEASE